LRASVMMNCEDISRVRHMMIDETLDGF